MKVDIVSKSIVYIHLFIVTLMAIVGFPQIIIYISLLWVTCGHMSIPLCEQQLDIQLPNIWNCRNLAGLNVLCPLFLK